MIENKQAFFDSLVRIARYETEEEKDFVAWGYDSAYESGFDDGQVWTARAILDEFGVEWRLPEHTYLTRIRDRLLF